MITNKKYLIYTLFLPAVIIYLTYIYVDEYVIDFNDYIQRHVEMSYIFDNGIVLNYKEPTNPQYLSESIGLYMQYLVAIGDEDRFIQQTQILLDNFIKHQDDYTFVKWELGDITSTNAVIDCLRLAMVLVRASEVFDNEEYRQLADEIIYTVKDTMIIDGRLVDFYDWHYNVNKNQLFLSYYIIDIMEYYNFPDSVYEPLENLVATPFFKEVYINGEYFSVNETEVNMIDQSLIATAYFQRTGIVEPNFQKFLEQRLYEDGKIYARYYRNSGINSNNNESSATYAFLLHYFELTGQVDNADKIRELLLQMKTYDPTTTHFFDFINKELALIGW